MPKHKIARKSTHIDMTAMCDVAFLLLTFFMLTTKFKPEEVVQVDTPTSVSEKIVESTHTAIITVDKEGKTYFDMLGRNERQAALTTMQGKYQIALNSVQENAFLNGSAIGCPMEELPTWLDKKAADRKGQPGIPIDTAKNELRDWLAAGLYIDPNLPFVIKADSKTEYPKIKRVIDILQESNINNFRYGSNAKD
jgi:biopolymer transport protein ExbD